MYALLAHRRPTSELQTGQFEVIISQRSYTCFNGFNDTTVFGFRHQDRSLYFRTDERGTVLPDTIKEANQMAATEYDNAAGRGWECLGMGWLAYSASQRENLVTKRQQNSDVYGSNVGYILSSERCTEAYYDAGSDRMVPSRRALTPNEAFIARFCQFFDHQPNSAKKASCHGGVLHGFQNNKYCNYLLYDFVGSERNSGRAVGYLQVFRNWSEQSYRAFADQTAVKQLLPTLYRMIDARLGSPVPSIIPTLSHLFNNGSDSDIISYAGANVCAYLSRCGYWESEPIWYNNRSMLQETRYVKGFQSSSLNQKFQQLVAARRQSTGRGDIWPASDIDPFQSLKVSVQAETAMTNLMTLNQIRARQSHTAEQKAAWLADLNNKIQNYWRANPAAAVDALKVFINNLPDLASPVPPTPALPSDGAAQGFTQWVETATVH